MKQLNSFVIVLIILSGIIAECCYANNPIQSCSTQYPQYPIGGYGGRFGGLLYGLAMQAPAHKSEVSKEIKEIDGAYYHIHTVVENDTYQTLANAYHTTKKTIKRLNPNVSIIRGASLMIPVSDKEMAEIIKREGSITNAIESTQYKNDNSTRQFARNNTRNSTSYSTPNSTSQPSTEKLVTLVVKGEGATKEEATKLALRSAIEQAFGVFVSANTQVLNDDIIRDEIATISSGNIQSYKELSYIDLGSTKVVSVEATVSVGKLISFAQSKGMRAELAGASFVMNMKMKDLNKANEMIALENLFNQLDIMAENVNLFDYKLTIGEPSRVSDDLYGVALNIEFIPNENTLQFYEIYRNTIQSLAVGWSEIDEYRSSGMEVYPYYLYKRSNPIFLRNDLGYHTGDRGEYFNILSDCLAYSIYKSVFKFYIEDSLNNKFYPALIESEILKAQGLIGSEIRVGLCDIHNVNKSKNIYDVMIYMAPYSSEIQIGYCDFYGDPSYKYPNSGSLINPNLSKEDIGVSCESLSITLLYKSSIFNKLSSFEIKPYDKIIDFNSHN